MTARRQQTPQAVSARRGRIFSVSLLSGVGLLFAAQGAAGSVLSLRTFQVNEVEVVWPARMHPSQRYHLRPAASIFRIDLDAVRQALQKEQPTVEIQEVRRVFPNHLVAFVRVRRMIAQVRIEKAYYPVSEDGVVTAGRGAAPLPDLPILLLDGLRGSSKAGGSIEHPSFWKAAQLLDVLQRQGGIAGHRASSIKTRGEDITLFLDSGLEIRFSTQHIESSWQQLLELMIQKPKILREARYIDLRFEDPVIARRRP